MEERVIMSEGGILVTTDKIYTRDRDIEISDIIDMNWYTEKKDTESLLESITLYICSAAFSAYLYLVEQSVFGGLIVLISGFIIASCLLYYYRNLSPMYVLYVTNDSEKINLVISTDRDFVEKVKSSIEQAVTYRWDMEHKEEFK